MIVWQLGDGGSVDDTPLSCVQLKLLCWFARREIIKEITFTSIKQLHGDAEHIGLLSVWLKWVGFV